MPREAVPTDETQEGTGTTSATCKPGSVAPRSSGVPHDHAGSAASSRANASEAAKRGPATCLDSAGHTMRGGAVTGNRSSSTNGISPEESGVVCGALTA